MADNNPAGATPVVPGATPGQNTPADPAAPNSPANPAPAPSATDDAAALGDPGKRALDAMKAERNAAKERAAAAEAELERLKAASLSDSEKAIAAARKEAETQAATKYQGRIRITEAKAALIAAGAKPSLVDLAVRADEFTTLKVTEEGEVEGLAEAVAAFKKARPDVFGATNGTPAPGAGSADQGPRAGGAPPAKAPNLQTALERRFAAGS